MITIGYSTREHNPKFIEYLKKSSGNKKIEVIEKINNGEKSLSQVYNEILEESKTDIVVLCHDDIYFDTTSWFYKLKTHFENTDYGILGVAGTTEMPSSGQWWETRNHEETLVRCQSSIGVCHWLCQCFLQMRSTGKAILCRPDQAQRRSGRCVAIAGTAQRCVRLTLK